MTYILIRRLQPGDSRFYGAWWIGMLISTALAWLAAIPILGYPRNLRGAVKIQMDEVRKTFAKRRRNHFPEPGPDVAVYTDRMMLVLQRCWVSDKKLIIIIF